MRIFNPWGYLAEVEAEIEAEEAYREHGRFDASEDVEASE